MDGSFASLPKSGQNDRRSPTSVAGPNVNVHNARGSIGGGGGGPPAGGSGSSGGGGAGQPYFVDQKKGEVNELKALLRNINVERDAKKKRDVIKKVIAYMTLGIDVSRLFTEMVMAIETRDLVIKKMVYLYLCTYAHAKPDLAIMCINTLQRDCNNEDPMVRGLALRSLCSLRLPTIVEYISEPLRRSLADPNAYVRKTGVMGILKLYHLAPAVVAEGRMVDTLYNMLLDPDAQVVSNCICALSEMMSDLGGMGLNRAIMLHLLSRLDHFSEWGLQHVLALAGRYDPVDEDEAFAIMNLLDPVLRTSNSGAVLATCKCFMHLTEKMPELQAQVFERFKAPLLTLMAGGGPELVYCVLKHVEALVHRCPGVFDDEYRQFYTRYNEPTNVKYAKVDVLSLLAAPQNLYEVVAELAEYVSDVDSEMARRAIRALGKICLRAPEAAETVVERLIGFLDLDVDYVRAETVLVMQSLLLKHPGWRGGVLPTLQRCLRRVEEPEGRAAVVWMVGEFGQEITEAPYMLEPLIDAYTEEASVAVKMQLLTAAVKLFFKRPPEMQSMLGRLLGTSVNDSSNQDVHDRALLYYRLLRCDAATARSVVCGDGEGRGPVVGPFAEERDGGLRDALMREFNTLSIVYGEASTSFTLPQFRVKDMKNVRKTPEELTAESLSDFGMAPPPPPLQPAQQLLQPQLLSPLGGAAGGSGGPRAAPPPPTQSAAPMIDLLGMEEDLLGGGNSGGGGESSNGGGGYGSNGGGAGVELLAEVSIDANTFQAMWGRLEAETLLAPVGELPHGAAEVEAALAAANVKTMASGDKPDALRLFVYGKDTDGATHLAQLTVAKAQHEMTLVVKTDASGGAAAARAFAAVVQGALTRYLA